MAIYNPTSNQHSDGRDSIASPEEYKIKITGEGTRKDIAKALRLIANAIHHPTSNGDGLNVEDIDGAEWEDCTLMTEINKV